MIGGILFNGGVNTFG